MKSAPATPPTLTIGRLARAAGVGIETVRYYQQRRLLPQPPRGLSVRRYPVAMVDRIRFIKRAQELGFSLDEIAELLRLEDGVERAAVRDVATRRLEQIARKLADLQRMRRVLTQLLRACEHSTADTPCPIIETFSKGRVAC
ncbi:MAG: MerR family DNA-binding protein [Gammaproteobacteria bacterium]